jgi:phosphohistidine phosphatase SixA
MNTGIENIFICRHAEYDAKTGKLTSVGIGQAKTLVENIASRLPDGTNVYIGSSTALRSREEAGYISEGLGGIVVEELPTITESDNGHERILTTNEQMELMYKFQELAEKDIGTIILVGHESSAKNLAYLGNVFCGIDVAAKEVLGHAECMHMTKNGAKVEYF